jgi:predicted anti-sigma-YlaC factor YlaD
MTCAELRSVKERGSTALTPEFITAAEEHTQSCEACRAWLLQVLEQFQRDMTRTLTEIENVLSSAS